MDKPIEYMTEAELTKFMRSVPDDARVIVKRCGERWRVEAVVEFMPAPHRNFIPRRDLRPEGRLQ